MDELLLSCLRLTRTLAQKSQDETLNEFEAQLYESVCRYSTTALRFADFTAQASLIEAERHLDELRDQRRQNTT